MVDEGDKGYNGAIQKRLSRTVNMYRLRVKEVATARGFNMSKLSRASDVSFSTIKRIFRDPYQPVGVDTLHKIALALGVPTSELIEDVAEENR